MVPLFVYLLPFILRISHGSYDVDEKELQYLDQHLTQLECRQLVEALHSDSLFLKDIPDGHGVAQNMSCIELLQQWDQKDSRKESFVRLAGRLRELGHEDLAKAVSQTILKDQEKKVELFVHDEMSTLRSDVEKESVIFLGQNVQKNDPEAHISEFDGRKSVFRLPDWTVSQKILFVISTLFLVGLFGFWFFHCIPDCFRSLCEICRRKPTSNRDDATHFLLTELDDLEDA